MRVLVTRNLPDRVITRAQGLFDVDLRSTPAPLTAQEAKEAFEQYDAILPTLGDDLSTATFAGQNQPRCKLLANFGVGYNHIDVIAAHGAGITVTNTPGAVTDATADIALTLMLMTARRAGEGERMLRSGAWLGWHPTQMLGQHMAGKTVGIIGMGRIGQAIAKRCHYGFDMPVLYYNRSPKPFDNYKQITKPNDLLAQSDFVVMAVPAGADTYHLIGADALAQMRDTAFLINIARGDVVDETALIAALKTGQIAGAGLDVYEKEPKVPADLCAMENVTLLPHLGTAALEVRENMGMMAVDNLLAWRDGKALPNLVSP